MKAYTLKELDNILDEIITKLEKTKTITENDMVVAIAQNKKSIIEEDRESLNNINGRLYAYKHIKKVISHE